MRFGLCRWKFLLTGPIEVAEYTETKITQFKFHGNEKREHMFIVQ